MINWIKFMIVIIVDTVLAQAGVVLLCFTTSSWQSRLQKLGITVPLSHRGKIGLTWFLFTLTSVLPHPRLGTFRVGSVFYWYRPPAQGDLGDVFPACLMASKRV